MSTVAKQFHEEEAIGKTYDFQVARRLLRYPKPYLRMLIPAPGAYLRSKPSWHTAAKVHAIRNRLVHPAA